MASSRKKKIAVVLADRANYGRLKPVLKLLKERDQIRLMLICAGSMLLNRFGSAVDKSKRGPRGQKTRIITEILPRGLNNTSPEGCGVLTGQL